jgi:S1-C subfamily serine protease
MDDQYNHGATPMANFFEDPGTSAEPGFPPPAPPAHAARRSRPGLRGAVAGGLVGALVAGGVGFAAGRLAAEDQTMDQTTAGTTVVQAAPAALADGALDLRTLLARVSPSVVSIQLGQASADQVVQFGAGSGVIISADGLVLTNAHVVDGADVIQVRLSDDRTIRADLVGTSPSHDIALVRLREAKDLQPATLGSSEAAQVGDQVVAIGNALALGDTPTVTTGIISAKGRALQDGEVTLENLMQTDAAINKGNSGGPLLDAAGRVIGINSAGIPGAENLGFAIEIDAIRPLIDQLRSGKGTEVKVQAFLGITSAETTQLTPAEAQQLGVSGKEGVVVVSVQPESAASDAGLQPGDLLREVDGRAVTGPETVRDAIRAHEPGATIPMEVERDGKLTTLSAVLGSQPVTAVGG